MKARMEERTFLNRCEAARILGISTGQLRQWQAATRRPESCLYGITLFAPALPETPLSSHVRYHRTQLALMVDALRDWSSLRRQEESWKTLSSALGEYNLQVSDGMKESA